MARIEALLFVASTPVTVNQLASALEISAAEAENGLRELEVKYQDAGHLHGIRLQRNRGQVQLVSAPSAAHWIERFLGIEFSARLSQAALETLAIIAYQQPITRPRIDAIRGVSSDGVLRSLLSKGLVEEIGRADSPGRPILYVTSHEFLQYFGLGSIDELPPIDLEQAQTSRDDDLTDE